ncbi:hypothetical protein DKX38_027697 [Salix brachista]|uniref:Uncharacterized protein n=1 Tax=Salix brachista TaxID=2182728 RepID=A0A5N5J3T0_9ROSI|nr:hypothetical protein DKX38_027697 [Salix brachista]
MGTKMRGNPPSNQVLPLLSVHILFIELAMAQITAFIPVNVGVVLDLDYLEANIALSCINMALSDFYANHGHYKTRMVLTTRDSKKDVVGAAAADTKPQLSLAPLESKEAAPILSKEKEIITMVPTGNTEAMVSTGATISIGATEPMGTEIPRNVTMITEEGAGTEDMNGAGTESIAPNNMSKTPSLHVPDNDNPLHEDIPEAE